MRVEVAPSSRLFIDLRATGLLRGVGHDPTLSARIAPPALPAATEAVWALEVGDGPHLDAAIEVVMDAAAIEPPPDLSAADREKMREHMLGPEVLDAARFPKVVFVGRYRGSLEEGQVEGQVQVRGQPRSLSLRLLAGSRSRESFEMRGAWEGRLTDLGIKPFRALFGALRLTDWIRFRLTMSLAVR